ncbi:MAG: hypothetical protein AAGI30_09700 [Planctomycetota bacterium]
MARRWSITTGISLVETLIVLAALLTLALLLQPRVTLASDQQVKIELDETLTGLSQSVAIYQMQTGGAPPALGTGEADEGWTPLITIGLVSQPPVNPYNGSTRIVIGTLADAMSHGPGSGVGWIWDREARTIHAAGYAPKLRLLFHERSFADVR